MDLKRFRPVHELRAGLLTVVEQTPGLVVTSDQTGTLARGAWPSYNVGSGRLRTCAPACKAGTRQRRAANAA